MLDIKGVAVAAVATLSAFPAAAADTRDSSPYSLIADRVTVEGKRVDYGAASTPSATKTDTPLIDIPQALTVISDDLIKGQAMRSLGDALRYVPGATMGQGEGHRDAPTLRGNATTADFYVDGVRDDVQYFRDLYNVERIEVIKGPNALIFGRGGGGGVINRVTRAPAFDAEGEIRLDGGQFGYGRASLDYTRALSSKIAARLDAAYENSDSYRDFTGVERYGVNPSAFLAFSDTTRLTISYERFRDDRTVDRGLPSLNGRPYDGDRRAFFGNPDLSHSDFGLHAARAKFESRLSPTLNFTNHFSFAAYDKFYSNVHANSPVDAAGDVRLQAYFSGTQRRGAFNQSDLVWKTETGPLKHQFLFGGEVGFQTTENRRTDNNNAAGVVNISDPTTFAPVVFAPTRDDNLVDLTTASLYIQDQIEVAPFLLLLGGARFDRFDLEFDDRRPGASDFSRVDGVFSPRGGVILKPAKNASLYFSYSKSFLPQSGDQFASLSATTAALEPEKFENLEAGAKWDIRPGLSLAGALYRLERTNTRAIDPMTNRTVLTGAQRSKGAEIELQGAVTDRWEAILGYAYQDAEITSTTTAAPAGRVVPLTPKHAVSIWSRYRLTDRFSGAVGVVYQARSFASISNAVELPNFTRVDAALFYRLADFIDAQVNFENLTNALYFPTAHNDNNITPGAPRSVRAALTLRL